MQDLRFDIRDIFSASRLGSSGNKIWIAFLGIAAGYVVHFILTHIAILAGSSKSIGTIWDTYGLFPRVIGMDLSWHGCVFIVLGYVIVLAILLFTSAMICKVAYQQLKGDDFYSSGDAFKFARGNWRAAILSPFFVLFMIAFLVVCAIIIGVIAHYIPYVGEVAFAVFLLPIFLVSLITIYMVLVFLASLFLAPAIVGTAEEDTIGTVMESFSTVWCQPWRLILYGVWLKLIVVLVTVIFGFFVLQALILINGALGLFMGEKLAFMMKAALWYIPENLFCFFKGGPAYLSLRTYLPDVETDPTGVLLWSGRILAIMLLTVIGIVYSYSLSVFSSGQAIIYLILKKKKDQDNLLERKDTEPQEEPVETTDTESTDTESTDTESKEEEGKGSGKEGEESS